MKWAAKAIYRIIVVGLGVNDSTTSDHVKNCCSWVNRMAAALSPTHSNESQFVRRQKHPCKYMNMNGFVGVRDTPITVKTRWTGNVHTNMDQRNGKERNNWAFHLKIYKCRGKHLTSAYAQPKRGRYGEQEGVAGFALHWAYTLLNFSNSFNCKHSRRFPQIIKLNCAVWMWVCASWVSKFTATCTSTFNEIINAITKAKVSKFKQQLLLLQLVRNICPYIHMHKYVYMLRSLCLFQIRNTLSSIRIHPLGVVAQVVHTQMICWLAHLLPWFVIGNCHTVHSDLKQRHVFAVVHFHLFTHVCCVFDSLELAFRHFLTLKWHSSMKRYRNNLRLKVVWKSSEWNQLEK